MAGSMFNIEVAEFLLEARLKEAGLSLAELQRLNSLREFIEIHQTSPASSGKQPLKEGHPYRGGETSVSGRSQRHPLGDVPRQDQK